MGQIHHLIERHGRQGALEFVDDRRHLDTAADYMSDENDAIGFLFSGWCQAALPHRRQPNDAVWLVETDFTKLMVEPGSLHTSEGVVRVGVPYGSRARLMLLYLQTEAIRTDSREISLGDNLTGWLKKMGIPIGGKTTREVRDQALRLSRCRMTFQIARPGMTGIINQNIMDNAFFSDDPTQTFRGTIKLSEGFFDQLKKHPVPIQESAIRAISNNSQAIDIYCWLAYRLHFISDPQEITWRSLYAQFGCGYSRLRKFRENFLDCLAIAMAVYPSAKVTTNERGVVLIPSPAPVAPERAKRIGAA